MAPSHSKNDIYNDLYNKGGISTLSQGLGKHPGLHGLPECHWAETRGFLFWKGATVEQMHLSGPDKQHYLIEGSMPILLTCTDQVETIENRQ